MNGRFGARLPPDGHPDLNDWLMHVASHHEAAHAVAAYVYRYPCLYVELQPITDGRVGERAHFVQDLEAVNIGLDFLNRRGLPCNKAMVVQCTVLEIGRAVNVGMNGVEWDQATRNAQCDIESRDEMFDLNGLLERDRRGINQLSVSGCRSLLQNRHFCRAVEAVADLLIRRRILSEFDVAQVIERETPLRCRPPDGEPLHSEIQSEAFYLHSRRVPSAGALDDWLSAERGLRFVKYCA